MLIAAQYHHDLMNRQQQLFKIEISHNITNLFILTFDQFNMPLLNKTIFYPILSNSSVSLFLQKILSTTIFNIDDNQKCFLSSKSVY